MAKSKEANLKRKHFQHAVAHAWKKDDAASLIAQRKIVNGMRVAGLHTVLDGGPGVVVLLCPEGEAETYRAAAERVSARVQVSRKAFTIDEKGLLKIPGKFRPDEQDFADAVKAEIHVWVVAASLSDVPTKVLKVTDGIVLIDPLRLDDLRFGFKAITGSVPSDGDLESVLEHGLFTLGTCLKRGVSAAGAIGRARRLGRTMNESGLRSLNREQRLRDVDTDEPRGPRVEDLHGYGEAAVWAKDLVIDIADYKAKRITWTDVDRGVLLSGPPGCGKTLFATALGHSTGMPVHVHSLARWQAKGYLNDLLKAMRAAFAEAQAVAPSILFIDEIDSIGDRNEFRGHNRQYCIEVVNALLECLDGAERLTGVVVVGATNHPGAIDPALRRAGRLDRHIAIPLPDTEAREGILRHHLGAAGQGFDLTTAARRTVGCSGADLEKAVRDARRIARRARRPLAVTDVEAALPDVTIISDAARWKTCVHEAGHAVVSFARGATVDGLFAPRELPRNADCAGFTASVNPMSSGTPGLEEYTSTMMVFLGGLAAEKLIFGSHDNGGRSDLRKATLLAVELEAATGLGGYLTTTATPDEHSLLRAVEFDPALRQRVETRLRDAFAEAAKIIEERKDVLLAVAKAAEEKETLGREDVAAILGPSKPDTKRVRRPPAEQDEIEKEPRP